MSAVLHALHFLEPWWLLALALLPALWWWSVRRDASDVALARLVDRQLLAPQLRGVRGRRALAPWLQTAAWLLAILALAGPTWSRQPQPLHADRAVQIVALSLSSHMRARDVVPSRLQRARFKVRDLLDANRDGLNALVAYAGEAFVVAPLTSDAHSLHDLLAALTPDTMPVDGNNAAAAIARAVTLARHAKTADASLVLVTDHAGAAALSAARAARAAGVRVSVLGVGTARGGAVTTASGALARDAHGDVVLAVRDDIGLTALAAAGGGRYVPMTANRDDIQILRGQLQAVPGTTSTEQSAMAWVDRGPWLLLPLLLLLALHFRRGWLCLLALTLLPMWPSAAQANGWADWWQRPDQQAAVALRQGDAKRAQTLARDPAWRAAADYRAGDFDAAAKTLRGVPGPEAAYNRGNALARSGDYAAALRAYDQALRLAPHMADATANRKAVADWLARQPPAKKPQASPDPPQSDQSDTSGKSPATGGAQKPADSRAAPAKHGAGETQPGEPSGGAAAPPPGSSAPAPARAATTGAPASAASAATPPAAASSANPHAANLPPPTAQQQAQQRAQASQAQAAVRQQMDAVLAKKSKPAGGAVHDLGAVADDAQDKLPADVRRALQAVPDDPGALLRRKFELEYQQRHGNAPDARDLP